MLVFEVDTDHFILTILLQSTVLKANIFRILENQALKGLVLDQERSLVERERLRRRKSPSLKMLFNLREPTRGVKVKVKVISSVPLNPQDENKNNKIRN
jgi:hypothetical protein